MFDYLNPLSDKFILKTIIDFLNPFSENFILKGVLEALQYINPFSDKFIFREFFANIGEMLSYINPFSENFFGRKIVEFIGDLLKNLFIPKQESFNKFTYIFNEKFAFIDSIRVGINSIKNMFNNVNSLPKFTLNIDSKIYKGELTIFDLAWYAKYKPYGDIVITGFTYIFFFWRLWCHLPSILQGVASGANYIEKHIDK